MKTRLKRLLCMALMLAMLCGAGIFSQSAIAADKADKKESALTYYVSNDGSDSNDGKSLNKPFATIEKARDTIRSLRAENKLPDGGITVYICSGTYSYLEEGIKFTAEDSGTEECPITYAAYGDEPVYIEGAKRLDNNAFTAASDDIKSRLIDKEAAEKLLQIDLKTTGIVGYEIAPDYGNYRTELLINENRGTVARYPNDAFLAGGSGSNRLYDTSDRMQYYQTVEYAFIRGYYSIDYTLSTCKINSFDPEEGLITAADIIEMGTHFYYLNVLEEIDMPGEYYIDFRTGMLYVYPTDDFSTAQLSMTQLQDDLISGTHVNYLTFEGLTIEGARGGGISLTGNHLTVRNCNIFKVNGAAVYLYGFNDEVTGCEVAYVASQGIQVEAPDTANLEPGYGRITYNYVHHYAQLNGTYNPGVQSSANGVQMYIAHNEIAYSIHNAMLANGNNMLVEYNIMHDICTEANDAGAVYTGGWQSSNVIFRYNFIYNCYNIHNFGGPKGFYVDDGGSNKIFYGNILYNIGGAAFMIGGGHDNQIYNNIVINAGTAITYDSRQYYGDWEENWAKFPSGASWINATKYIGYCSRNWCTWYPAADLISRSNIVMESPFVGGSFGLARYRANVEIDCNNQADIYPVVAQYSTVRDNVTYRTAEEVKFKDFENLNLALEDDSPIFYDIPGFQKIAFEKIGRN